MGDPFIYEIDANLDGKLCDAMVAKFEADTRKHAGVTLSGIKDVKKTTDLMISDMFDWRNIDRSLLTCLESGFREYVMHLRHIGVHVYAPRSQRDKGYQIQKYERGRGVYEWHQDFAIHQDSDEFRSYAFIWYLNDVDNGGETEFHERKVVPKKGKLLIFPATFTYMHKGNIPLSGDKYICGGWMVWPTACLGARS